MLNIILVIAFVAKLNLVLTDTTPCEDTSKNSEEVASSIDDNSDSTPQCGLNEVPSDCATKVCRPTCAQPDLHLFCDPNPIICKPGCVCAEGYLRDLSGVCVRKDKCPFVLSCGENEIYYSCPAPSCVNRTCENIDKLFDCPLTPFNYTCKGECRCKDEFYKNKIGKCISEEQCKMCPGEYEYYACDNEYDKLSKQSNANYPYNDVKCTPKCYCLEGYARDANGKCMPISQCPHSSPTV